MSYCVYKHTTPSGKVYIGITSKKPEKRWNYGNGYVGNEYFFKAIKKYGWDNITHEILLSGLSRDEAGEKEREFISEFHSFDRKYGYNLTTGGEKGRQHDATSRAKMSESKKGMYIGILNPRFGVPCSEETKRRISIAVKGKMAGEKNPNYGKPISAEQKKKISAARKGNHYPKLSESVKNSPACIAIRDAMKVPVIQYTKDGVFVKEWESAPDASFALLGHRRGQCNICSCANGKVGSAYGFVWRHGGGESP